MTKEALCFFLFFEEACGGELGIGYLTFGGASSYS